jgi:hypothetical protein
MPIPDNLASLDAGGYVGLYLCLVLLVRIVTVVHDARRRERAQTRN